MQKPNEIFFLRYIFFEIWLTILRILKKGEINGHFFVPKDAQCSEKYAKTIFRFI